MGKRNVITPQDNIVVSCEYGVMQDTGFMSIAHAIEAFRLRKFPDHVNSDRVVFRVCNLDRKWECRYKMSKHGACTRR